MLADAPEVAARAAGLRYVTDAGPGIRRKRSGREFKYLDPDGRSVRDGEDLARIRALVIPPAWTDVWICPIANGHLQVTGRDARGRKQYRYHARWRETRDETKYSRLAEFGRALPEIRKRVNEDLAKTGLPREKVLATVVRLLETTLIRVGNEEYAKENKSFGLTTMRNRHVDVEGGDVHFHFRGKSGLEHSVDIHDARMARVIRRLRDIPGQELFQYVDGDGARHSIDSGDVNAYLKEITGEDFTAKDFRTWAGTVLGAKELWEAEPAETEKDAKQRVVDAVDVVAERLGNTRAVCRKCYVHPAVIDGYLDGTLGMGPRRANRQGSVEESTELSAEERAVVRLLRRASGGSKGRC